MELWKLEPNYMVFNHYNIKCEIKRHHQGHLLGYIYIPQNNVYYGLKDLVMNQMLSCKEEISYCEEENGFWKIGFDFGHIHDYVPNIDDKEDPEVFKLLNESIPLEIKKQYRGIEEALKILKEITEEIATKKGS